MSNKNDVQPGSSPADGSDNDNTPPVTIPPKEPAVPGSQTPSDKLLAGLQEEREKVKKLEAEKAKAEERARLAEEALASGDALSDDNLSDEAKLIIDKHVKPLSDELSRVTNELTEKQILEDNPLIKPKLAEFRDYLKAHPGYKATDAAKLFIDEQGLNPQRRPGLEEPRGGDRTPKAGQMTPEEIDHLRETNYKQYLKLLRAGKLTLSGND